jgi:ribulose-phosphate 3-epimerase
MIADPERYLEDFKAAGADMLTVHVEASRHMQRVLAQIRALGMRPGLALNPATPLEALEYLLDDIDMALIMSVNPGFGGQSFIPASYAKIRKLRAMLDARRPGLLIQVDGGVTPENTPDLVKCGADVLVSGSAFFNFPPYATRCEQFERAAVG